MPKTALKQLDFRPLIIYFFLGFSSIIVQSLLIREFLVVFFGNELVLGIIFGAWFFWISIGAQTGSRLAFQIKSLRTVFCLSILIGLFLFPLQLYLIRSVRSLLAVSPGQYIPFLPMLAFTFLCTAPFSFMVGWSFPLGSRLLDMNTSSRAITIGWLYITEAVGSLVGGLIFTFLLVGHFSSWQLGAALFLFTAFLLPLLIGKFVRRRFYCLLWVAAIAILSLLVLPFAEQANKVTLQQRWRSLGGASKLIASVDSKYENLVLAQIADQYSLYGNGQVAFIFPDPYGYANTAYFVLTQHPNPKHVLIIGDALGGLLHPFLQAPIQKLDYVQLDPQITNLVLPYLSEEQRKTLSDPRLDIFYTDGRFFLKTTSSRYDLVFLNLPDPTTAMMNRYYTREFFQEVQRVLKPGGVFAFSIRAAETYFGLEVENYAASIFQTLRRVFPHVVVSGSETNFFFASDSAGIVTVDIEILTRRFACYSTQTAYFSPYNFYLIFQPERVEFIRRALENAPNVRLNTDLQPITYFYNLLLWHRFASGINKTKSLSFVKQLSHFRLSWLIFLLALLLVVRLIFLGWRKMPRRQQSAFNALAAVAISGFAAMGFEIVLLFGFQNLYGYLYHMIALVTATFMLGLALGSLVMNYLLNKIRSGERTFICLEALILLFALILPALLNSFASGPFAELPLTTSQILFSFLILNAGMLTGAGFPLASHLYLRHKDEIGRAAGLVDSFDHLGACLGGFLTGTLLVPVLGTVQSVYFIALLNAGGIFLWIVNLIFPRKY